MRRFSVVVCHRRFGKTVLCVNHLIRAAAHCEAPRPRFAYLAPTYRQAKAVAWDYLKHFTRPIHGTQRHEGELRIDLPNGARIALLGADNPDALRGLYLDGVVFDEYGQMAPRIFGEVVRPALADREGWAIFIGTPQGRNGFHEIYEAARLDPDWFTALHPASKTGLIAEAELAAARRIMTPEEYAQEFECSFEAAAAGSYYGRLIEEAAVAGRIGPVPHDPRLPVHTSWDLGMDDSTAIWFAQAVGAEVRLIGYYEASGEGLEHYVRLLQSRGFVYGEHWLPHDAEVRELGTGVSRIETLASLGLKPRLLPALRIEDGVNAARLLLPRCWFDRDACAAGLAALRHYRRDYDEKLRAYRSRPVHDWSSHGADAFRYLAVGLAQVREGARALPKRDSRWVV